MIGLFHFREGKLDFRQRYAQTDKWKLERHAGRALFGGLPQPAHRRAFGAGQDPRQPPHQCSGSRGQAVCAQGGQSRFAHGPADSRHRGYTDFGGKMQGKTFCAHPKIDPLTGNMCAFGYAAKDC